MAIACDLAAAFRGGQKCMHAAVRRIISAGCFERRQSPDESALAPFSKMRPLNSSFLILDDHSHAEPNAPDLTAWSLHAGFMPSPPGRCICICIRPTATAYARSPTRVDHRPEHRRFYNACLRQGIWRHGQTDEERRIARLMGKNPSG